MQSAVRGILSCLNDLAAKDPSMPLLGGEGRWFDVRTVLAIAEHVGSRLRRMGLPIGSFVAFHPSRNMSAALMLLGLRSAGLVPVLAEPKQSMEEILHNTDADLSFSAHLEQSGKTQFSIIRTDGDRRRETIDLYSLAPTDGVRVSVSPDEPAFIIFTSGSTGKSKAVVLSEANLVSNLLDSQPLGDYRIGDRALGCLPLHHVFGLVLLAGTAVLRYGVYFPDAIDIPSLLSALQQQKLTRMNGVPSLYLALAEQCRGYALSSMRAGFIGGGPVTPEQFTQIEEKLGVTLISVYGMSECVGISCSSWQDSRENRAAGVGRFYPMNTGKILREDGSEAGPSEKGEICVTGPMRMIGYLGQAMPREELLHTGDLGYLDADGMLHLTGRIKDIIIRNGNNLSARRIEQAILQIPGVKEAAVVALPDERQGEVPAAMIVADHELENIAPDLPKNALPVLYRFVHQLALTASGKPDKQQIREMLIRYGTE